MTQGVQEADLPNVLFDAALQSKFMQARRADLEAETEEGLRFIYGVDTNVLRRWGNPRTDAPDRPNHLGRIFRNDENDLATAVSWGLLNFIFEHLGDGDIQLILVPPMECEVASTLEALHETDPESPSLAVQQQIAKVLDKLRAEIPAHELSALSVELKELLFDEIGEHAELRRMLLLFSRQRVRKLDEAGRRMPENLRDVLLPTKNVLSRWMEYSEARTGANQGTGWDERLARTGRWKSEHLRDNDAEALARIEVWNHHFVRNKLPWRFLYITADMRLFEAASSFREFEGADGRSFAEAYLRHPRAFLSEQGVLGAVSEVDADGAGPVDGESVGDWLRMATHSVQDQFGDLFQGWRRDGELPLAQRALFDDASPIVRDSGEGSANALAASLLEKWKRFAQGALTVGPDPAEGLLGLTRDRKQSAKEMLDLLKAAEGKLELERRSTLRQYLYVTTLLGQTLEAHQTSPALIREVPPIYFEDWKNAGRAVAIMSRWPHKVVDDKSYQAVVDLIDLDDETSYAFYLANASFFAARNRWRTAALLARRARAIAIAAKATLPEGQETKGANGREAAYFEAVCRMRLAREREDLGQARECLEDAYRVLETEKRLGKYHDFVEERLTILQDTIDLADFYFASSKAFDPSAYDEGFRALADRFWRSFCDIRSPRPAGDSAEAVETRRRVTAHLCAQVIGLAFLPQASAVDDKHALECLTVLNGMLAEGEIADEEFGLFEKAYLSAARLRSGHGRTTRNERRDFNSTVAALQASKGHLAPYEHHLLTELQRCADLRWRSA